MRPREFFRYYFDEKPLVTCIWIAFLVRILTAFFSQGIVFGYDHYIYIEAAQDIINRNGNISDYFTKEKPNILHQGYSVIYILINTLILKITELSGVFNPQSKIFVIKLIHSLASLLIVYYGFCISKIVATTRHAKIVGMLLALLWFYPYCSVRALAENISTIFLLAGIYRMAKGLRKQINYSDDLFTGFLFGIGFSFSYNTGVFIIGEIICISMRYGIKRAMFLTTGTIISVVLFEGVINTIIFKQPFLELSEYVPYVFKQEFPLSSFNAYYMYPSILILIFLLPWGLGLFYGFIKSWKKYFLLFFPVTFYIIIHYLLPLKEERFMLNILPIYIMLSVFGWHNYRRQSKYWRTRNQLYYIVKRSFWVVNFIALCLATISYMRKPQVETMIYLSKYKSEIKSILIEDRENDASKLLPPFYFGNPLIQYTLNKQENPDVSIYNCYVKNDNNRRALFTEKYFLSQPADSLPQFVIFYDDYDMPNRLSDMQKIFPNLYYEKTIDPSITDKIISYFNHSNVNVPLKIYRTREFDIEN